MNGPSNASAGDKSNSFMGHCKGHIQGVSPLMEFLLIASQLMGLQSIKAYILSIIPTCFHHIHLYLIHTVSWRLWDFGGLLSPRFPLCRDLQLVFCSWQQQQGISKPYFDHFLLFLQHCRSNFHFKSTLGAKLNTTISVILGCPDCGYC